jgi:hypothetical protein
MAADDGKDHVPDRVESRAHLLPEEAAAGSADPEAQAAAILGESDERTDHPEDDARESKQTIPVATAEETQTGGPDTARG